MSYSVDLCAGFDKIGEATAFEFDGVLRLLQVGEWRLSASLAGLECEDVGSVDSVIVYDDSDIQFAGVVRRVGSVDGGVTRSITSSGTSLEFRGVDVYGILAQRRVYPTPSTEPPWADAHDIRSGVGSSVAAGFIAANLGSTALASRQLPSVAVVDPSTGSSSTWAGRLQPLDELVGRICRESGIVCVATMTAPGEFRFLFRSPNDFSSKIIFTDQGDLEQLSRLVSPAAASHVIAAGQGQLTGRSFALASTGETGLERVELVYENTNITATDGLESAADYQLVLNGDAVSVDGQVAAGAAQTIRLGHDYELGDWIGVEVDSVRYSAQVEAVTFALSASSQVVRPVLGRASTNEALNLIRSVTGIESRLDNQIA